MKLSIYVYSTLTNDQKYTKWSSPVPGNLPQVEHAVLIKGGSNLSSGSAPYFRTPIGISTHITEEDYAVLLGAHPDPKDPQFMSDGDFDFKTHMKSGFIIVRKDDVDPEKVVTSGMKTHDQSAPFTPASAEFARAGAPKVEIGKPDIAEKIRQ